MAQLLFYAQLKQSVYLNNEFRSLNYQPLIILPEAYKQNHLGMQIKETSNRLYCVSTAVRIYMYAKMTAFDE